jgi:oligoribonuclease
VSDRLVWIDCEMTGLDLGSDLLIEVAALVTDAELNVLGNGIDVVIGATEEQLARMPDVVRDMHALSGLTQEVLASTVTVEQAEQQVLAYLKEHVEPGKAPLCGNSIATDRGFLARDMKELARRWYPRAYFHSPKKAGGHRALADIHESVRELAYYRATVFVPPPGPTGEEANAAAAALTNG